MKKITEYEKKLLKKCVNFKESMNMDFEVRVDLFIRIVSTFYFDFLNQKDIEDYENIYKSIIHINLNDVFNMESPSNKSYLMCDFDLNDVIIAFLTPLLERQPITETIVKKIYAIDKGVFSEYSFLFLWYAQVPISLLKLILKENPEIKNIPQFLTEEEYDLIAEYSKYNNYTEYLEDYIIINKNPIL